MTHVRGSARVQVTGESYEERTGKGKLLQGIRRERQDWCE